MARKDPFKNFRFRLEIDGIQQGGFTDCTGITSSVEVVEYREGGDPNSVRKLPAKRTVGDVTLKWGVTDSEELYAWFATTADGQIQRKNGSIILLDDNGQEAARWNFFNAWASKYSGPDLTGKGNDVAVESVTISCEQLIRV